MTTLESRYRRLLRIYPATHRAAYEDEMLGVLMAGSPPDRRFPGPADAVDLIRGGLTARLGRALQGRHGTGWREAAAVTGLFTALVMVSDNAGTLISGLLEINLYGDPMRAHGLNDALLADPALRLLAWLALAVAALSGRGRAAALLSRVVVAAELTAVLWWAGMDTAVAIRLSWAPVVAIVTALLFGIVRPARPVREVLPRRSGLLVAAALPVMALAEGVLTIPELAWRFPYGLRTVWADLPLVLLVVAVALIGAPVRGRVVVLGLAVCVGPAVFLGVGESPALPPLVLVLAPAVVLAAGVVALSRAERFAARRRGEQGGHE
ncbi:hypothetical protein ACWT_7389 [Actinoplanes sp. SE50]|uniref:hypothetical protein n=1 Tax=unclassified Actinoplanes TaxID=2626549 RepID=UPI00023EE02D|nr:MULTISPECIES: hypothetical protein [unclassified Actinoplanes]AEV88399.1 hypothetical protein ACPL_7519 [Actinoplanes sp. SE50/110]ATO86804.1 hypothetical protein ACWT_7389 [Actinoplanes sp. SE50]SLM04222.1 hypothetical protein ACSP50_7525 [Actinoplanes sp. SE50/110]